VGRAFWGGGRRGGAGGWGGGGGGGGGAALPRGGRGGGGGRRRRGVCPPGPANRHSSPSGGISRSGSSPMRTRAATPVGRMIWPRRCVPAGASSRNVSTSPRWSR